MKKLLILFLSLLFLINFSSSIKISPTYQKIKMDQYETKCVNIWVLPEENYSISSRWSIDGKGDIEKYKLSSEKIKISFNYTYLEKGKYEFCFNPKKGGNFSGIIFFYSDANIVEIGSWVELEVRKIELDEEIIVLTENVIKDIKEKSLENKNEILFFIFALLLFSFFFIIFYKKNTQNKNSA